MPRSKPPSESPIDRLIAKIDEVREDRDDAKSTGSFTAVATLHRLEVEIVNRIWELSRIEEEEKRRKIEEDQRNMTDDQLIAALTEQIRSLPNAIRQRVVRELVAASGH